MTASRLYLIATTALYAFAIAIDAGWTADWLNANGSPQKELAIVNGVNLLRALFLIDGLLLLLILWWSKNHVPTTIPAWWTSQSTSLNTGDRSYSWCLLGIMLVATVSHSISLNSDLWIDEVFTLVDHVRLSLREIFSQFTSDNQHMLYSILANISIGVFGESPASLRLPALIFGLASIWATARLARYVFGPTEALFAALLLAFSYHHVWFSQNARGYTLLLFGTIVSTELLLRGLATRKWRYWVGYAIIIALTAWAHLTGVFVAIAHGIILLLLGLRHLHTSSDKTWQWQPFLALLLAAWFTIHLYALILPQVIEFFSQSMSGPPSRPVAWKNPLWLVNEILRNLGIGTTLGWAGIAIASAVGAYGFFYAVKRDALFVWLTLSPAVVLVVVFISMGRNLWPRMLFNEMGAFAIIAVVGALGFGILLARYVRIWLKTIRFMPMVVLCVLFSLSLPRAYQYPKQDFTGARQFVESHRQPGDTVLGLLLAGQMYKSYYAPEWSAATSLAEFNENESSSGYTWTLHTLPNAVQSAYPEIHNKLKNDYEIIEQFPGTLGDGEIIVSRSKKQGNQ